MKRSSPRAAGWRALAALLTACATLACVIAPERPILDQFFKHSRLRDKTALTYFSTTILEPLEQGIVTEFRVVDRSPLAWDRNGDIAAKDVTVSAPVQLPSGQVERKTLIVRMERQETGWKITAVEMKD